MPDNKPEHPRFSSEEWSALPDKAKEYIFALESELKTLTQKSSCDNDELRRKRYAYWNR
jgi:hypothetical protein